MASALAVSGLPLNEMRRVVLLVSGALGIGVAVAIMVHVALVVEAARSGRLLSAFAMQLGALRAPAAGLPDGRTSPIQMNERRESYTVELDESAATARGARRGLRVSRSVILQAVVTRSWPTMTPEPAVGERPAGLRLGNASSFGSSLADGDVVTAIDGIPTTAASVAIGVIAAAVARGAPSIGGVVWRHQTPLTVTVELPTAAPPAQAVEKPKGQPPEPAGGLGKRLGP